MKLQKRAATVGFDWDFRAQGGREDRGGSRRDRRGTGPRRRPPNASRKQFGDLLFAAANLARHMKVDPEAALRAANAKFTRRFKSIETALATQGRTTAEASLDEMEALWQVAKKAEKT